MASQGLRWVTGPFVLHLKAPVPGFADYLTTLYGEHQVLSPPWTDIADFHIRLIPSRGLRRFIQPKVSFRLDGNSFLAPFPLDHAPPLFEWGLNMSIASRANQFLLLHAAVVEKGGRGLILPGNPGSGKSTLCAALASRGFRLLSDEFGLLSPRERLLVPNPRPVALKNESIDILRAFAANAVLGREFPNTRKGTVCHFQPPPSSVEQSNIHVPPAWVVFPTFRRNSPTFLQTLPQEEVFLRMAENAFNYETMGQEGFEIIAWIVRSCQLLQLTFGDLAEAVAQLETLTSRPR